MKNILSALLLSATLFACNNSENAKDANETAKTSTINKTEIEAKLLGMEEAWNNSNMEKDHGLKFQTEILADDFISHNNKGEVENKEAVLTSIKKGDYTVSEVKNGLISPQEPEKHLKKIIGISYGINQCLTLHLEIMKY